MGSLRSVFAAIYKRKIKAAKVYFNLLFRRKDRKESHLNLFAKIKQRYSNAALGPPKDAVGSGHLMGGLGCFLGLCEAVLFLNAKIFMCIQEGVD